MKTVPDKHVMLELLLKGEFGNHMPVWWRLEDLMTSGFSGPVAIRYKIPGNLWQQGLPTEEIPQRVEVLERRGLHQRLMYFHAWPPYGTLAMNFNVIRSGGYWDMDWSTNPNLRVGQRHCAGSVAVATLRSVCGDESWDSLHEVWGRYPNSAIDGTYHCIAAGVGESQLLIWEVRNY